MKFFRAFLIAVLCAVVSPVLGGTERQDGTSCSCATDAVDIDVKFEGAECTWQSGVCKPKSCNYGWYVWEGRCWLYISNDDKKDKTTSDEYTIDPRVYVKWGGGSCPKPYDKLLMMDDGGRCTAEYIAPNKILTAQHCVVDENNDIPEGRKRKFVNCHGDTVMATVESYGDNKVYKGENNEWGVHSVPVDWAVLSVDDEKFYGTEMFDLGGVASRDSVTVNNAGWGGIPILSDRQIKDLHTYFMDYTKVVQEIDKNSFGYFMNEFAAMWDADELKVHKNCQMFAYGENGKKWKKRQYHSATCYSWGGNSGGPYYTNNDRLVGIVSGGVRALPDEEQSRLIVPTDQYITQEQKNCETAKGTQWHNNICSCTDADKTWRGTKCECKEDNYVIGKNGKCQIAPKPVSPEQKKCESQIAKKSGASWNGTQCVCSVAGTYWGGEKCQCPDPKETVQDGVCKTSPRQRELDDAKNEFIEDCLNEQKLKAMSDYEFLSCLGLMSRLQQLNAIYQRAKENEQSLANRTLGGLTMAATGIGGMELAMGLAEQKADKAAEADMTAYVSTFNCKVGDKRYSGTDKNIEIPGANQLTKMYQEYVDLAASIKERKEALGMQPGLEAEVVLDKSNMGLYDDVGHGIENGAYASLYRASKGNENDINKLQEQQDASKKRVTAGAVIGGVGAAGGIVGNILINGDKQIDTNKLLNNEYIAQGKENIEQQLSNYGTNKIESVNPDQPATNYDTTEVVPVNTEPQISDYDATETVPVNTEQQVSDSDANNAAALNAAVPSTNTNGCGRVKGIILSVEGCVARYSAEPDLSRCKKCVNKAGTYENGRCFIDVVGWACLSKGWKPNNPNPNPAPCSEANQYSDCHIIRKYVDAEKPFVCDPTELMPGKTAVLSGCGQHGWTVGAKHPPMNLDGAAASAQNCKLPLANNTGWRKLYSKGSMIGINYKGKEAVTANWCMPSAKSSPWNSSNHTGTAKHLNPSALMAGGESIDKWFSLD